MTLVIKHRFGYLYISNTRDRLSPHLTSPKRELKIRQRAKYFWTNYVIIRVIGKCSSYHLFPTEDWIENITNLSRRHLSHSLTIIGSFSGTFYDTREELLQGLKSGELDGALKDVFTVNSLIKDLNDSEFEVSKTVSRSFHYGIELTGEARHLLKDFKEYLTQKPFLALLDSSSSETTPTVTDKEEVIEFFDPENSLYQQAVRVTGLVFVVFATSGLVYHVTQVWFQSRKGKIPEENIFSSIFSLKL